MHRKHALPILSCLLALALSASAATAERLRVRSAGAASATEIDVDDDGIPGIVALGEGKGSLGAVATHSFFDARPVATTHCAATEIENELVAASDVIRNKRRDQLFLQLVEGFLCIDPLLGTLRLSASQQIVGGTGRFAGASGEATTTCDGVILVLDLIAAGGRPAHAAFECLVTGDLVR